MSGNRPEKRLGRAWSGTPSARRAADAALLDADPACLPELPRAALPPTARPRADLPRYRLTLAVSLARVVAPDRRAPAETRPAPPGSAPPERPVPVAPAPRDVIAAPAPRVATPARPVAVQPVPRRSRRLSLIALFGLLGLINLVGLPYFLLSDADRLRSPLHDWFKPSGFVGQSAGIVAFVLFLFLWIYPVRKKYAWLGFTGTVRGWLDVHVVVGLATPLLAALHASWRFGGLIGLGYAALFVVALSGIVGRYLYVRIPRAKTGIELTIDELQAERRALLARIESDTGLTVASLEESLSAAPVGQADLTLGKTVLRLLSNDVQRFRATRRIRRRLKHAAGGSRRVARSTITRVLRLARRELALTQQARILESTHRVFRYWHAAHRPIAIIALLALIIHVVAVISLGVTWFW